MDSGVDVEFTAVIEESPGKAVVMPKSFVIIVVLVILTYSMMGWYQRLFAGRFLQVLLTLRYAIPQKIVP